MFEYEASKGESRLAQIHSGIRDKRLWFGARHYSIPSTCEH